MQDWDAITKHKEFEKTETYGPFLQSFLSIVGGEGGIVHADFKPEGALAKCFSAPITEVVTLYFDGGPPDDYLDDVAKLTAKMKKENIQGVVGAAAGITYEEVEKDGVKGKAAVVLIGWESIDVHMEFRKTDFFKENMGLLRSNAKKITMSHVKFLESV